HHLDERTPAKAMLEVVAGIAGLHAQVMSSAELTLEARVEGLEPGAVRRALWEERSLVKTWAMRGTLHLLPAAEFPMWQAARSTRRWWETGSWQRGFGVTLDELERLNDAVAQALDGQLLTREELADRVGKLTRSKELGGKLRESWGALLKPAAALGLICFAPSQGQQVRFTRPDTWLGGWTSHDPAEAMDQVTRRFLAASGPVTREDFARWWGIPSPAQGRKLLERLGEEVARVEVEGAAAYALAADLPGLTAAGAGGSPTVRLLPAFDQYVVTATLHAERLMPGPFKARVYRPQGWLSPVLLVGGRMEGVWTQEVKGRRVQVTIEPFAGPLPARVRRAAEAEAERLAGVAGGQLELRWADA
ncbi:MAG TPA: winged helix DNA-binding domain-containing protein, partial [Actinomycetota bacterium]|nr:winged helix DNA-binding domain-containing protein [Actinomycetota bacterium]